jgi:Flp pilus assembly CpaF family ATPase
VPDLVQLPVAQELARRIQEKLRRELGPVVCAFLDDPQVIEVMLNPDGRLWVERLGEPMRPAGTMSGSQAESLMATVAATLRTTITRENPILECELPLDGSRFEAWIPPVVHFAHLYHSAQGFTGLQSGRLRRQRHHVHEVSSRTLETAVQ